MEISISKNLMISYFAFAMVTCFLFIIGKLSPMPIAIGLTGFTVYFVVLSIKSLVVQKNQNALNALIFWGIAVLTSIQVVLLFG